MGIAAVLVLLSAAAPAHAFRLSMMSSASPFGGFQDLISQVTGGGLPGQPKALESVAITGASGLIGTALAQRLRDDGVRVARISSSPGEGVSVWDPEAGVLDPSALEGVDAVVHLAGENVASGEGPLAAIGRWSDSKKDKILRSREQGTRLVVDTIAKLERKPSVLVCASGVGYYGYEDNDTVFDEAGPKGGGFLADVVEAWEAEADRAADLGVRVVKLRFAPVLSTRGGALAKLLPIFSLGGGGNLGSGSQAFSWVSIADAARAAAWAVSTPSLRGAVNVCSPEPVTNAEFTAELGKALSRPAVVPVPEPVAKVVFGEMGEEMLLGGQRAVPAALLRSGFEFEDPTLGPALTRIISSKM